MEKNPFAGGTMSDTTRKFKVGDKVKSAPDSSDVVVMEATWIATIYKIVGENDEGGCYETLGYWSNEPPSEALTLRQLWGSHLTSISEGA
jgi:hypothetical protein